MTSAGSMASRPRATQTSPGSSTSCTTSRPGAPPASSSPTAPCPRTNPAKARYAQNLIEADLVDCVVALPGQLFRSTQIPACLWFLSRGRSNGEHRDRRGEILFIDARKMGHMVDRTHRDLSQEDIARVADTYHVLARTGCRFPSPRGRGSG